MFYLIDEWYRGLITEAKEEHFSVDYFDFGNKKDINKTEAEYSFRQLDPWLGINHMTPASIRVELKNVPSFQQYNFLQRILKEHIKALDPMNMYVMAYCNVNDSYQVQLDDPTKEKAN